MITDLLINVGKLAIVVGLVMAALEHAILPAAIGFWVAATAAYLADLRAERVRRRRWREMFRRLDQRSGSTK